MFYPDYCRPTGMLPPFQEASTSRPSVIDSLNIYYTAYTLFFFIHSIFSLQNSSSVPLGKKKWPSEAITKPFPFCC